MKDILRLLRYVRPYVGRLAAAAVSSALISLVYLGLLALIQPILELFFPGASTLAGAGGGKLRPFEHLTKLLRSGGTALPRPPFAPRLGEGEAGRAVLGALLVVLPVCLKA